MKNRGGRGHPGRYKTDVMRIPIPIRKQVETVISRYQQYLENVPDADPHNPPDLINSEKDVTATAPLQQSVQELDIDGLALLLQLRPVTVYKADVPDQEKFRKYLFDRGWILIDTKDKISNKKGEGKKYIVIPKPKPDSAQ